MRRLSQDDNATRVCSVIVTITIIGCPCSPACAFVARAFGQHRHM